MDLEKIVFQNLESIVGPDYVTNDPAILEAYSKQPWPHGILLRRRPFAVVIPSCAEEIQSIYRVANRYKYIVIPAGNYNWDVPTKAHTIVIDPKRMNKIIDIDEKKYVCGNRTRGYSRPTQYRSHATGTHIQYYGRRGTYLSHSQ